VERAAIKTAIKTLMLVRLNVLPPYCYDHDESEHDPDEYLAYFRERLPECLRAIDQYAESLVTFTEDSYSEISFVRLQEARRWLIESLPFAEDEMDPDSPDYDSLVRYLRTIYEKEAGSWSLKMRLGEYRQALEDLRRSCLV